MAEGCRFRQACVCRKPYLTVISVMAIFAAICLFMRLSTTCVTTSRSCEIGEHETTSHPLMVPVSRRSSRHRRPAMRPS
jgi:hypothetical protein